ncbi:MAG: trehalase family glycosidase [Anaerolineales bacterium]
MSRGAASPYLERLRNRIDPERVPFSDRGSRLLFYKYRSRSAFYIKLAERLETLQPGLETHRDRPPYLSEITLLDGEGHELEYELQTYPHVLHCQTRIGRFSFTFADHDTIALGLPPGEGGGIALTQSALFQNSRASADDLINRRRVALTANVEPCTRRGEAVNTGLRRALIVSPGEGAAIHISLLRGDRASNAVQPFPQTLADAEERWNAWFNCVPIVDDELEEPYAYAWWSLANNLVAPLGNLRYEALMPSKAQYLGIWNWDACFHALALRHADPGLARDQLRTLLEAQLEDGMLPDVVHDEGFIDHIDHPIPARVTKPPVMAWAALKIHELDRNLEFLREIYPALKRWNRWWFEQRSGEIEGLAHFRHPYSSGLDDNPMWDHGFPVIAVDLNTYLVIQMDSLAAIAEQLNLDGEARAWRARAGELGARMLEVLYDPAGGFFWPRHAGEAITVRTPFNLYPLWTGRMPADVEAQLIGNLTTPDLFWAPYPLRTVARSEPSYAPTTMWRGPVWININYIFIEALEMVGRDELAGELRRRTIELVARNRGIYEYYSPEDGVPADRAAPIFGWSAALFVDLCIQARN